MRIDSMKHNSAVNAYMVGLVNFIDGVVHAFQKIDSFWELHFFTYL